jgi:hypothetical protein
MDTFTSIIKKVFCCADDEEFQPQPCEAQQVNQQAATAPSMSGSVHNSFRPIVLRVASDYGSVHGSVHGSTRSTSMSNVSNPFDNSFFAPSACGSVRNSVRSSVRGQSVGPSGHGSVRSSAHGSIHGSTRSASMKNAFDDSFFAPSVREQTPPCAPAAKSKKLKMYPSDISFGSVREVNIRYFPSIF